MLPLTNLPPSAYLKIAEEVNVPLVNLVNAITLIEEGATVPFLARYRKDAIGNMDEQRLRLLQERLAYYWDFEDRRQAVLRSLQEQGRLTSELRARIEATFDPHELEDLDSSKPRRKSRASAAREKGLEPLAEWLWVQQPDGRTPESVAETMVRPEGGVESAEQALAGARDIIAERLAEDPEIRKALRRLVWDEGFFTARKSERADELAAQQKDAKPKYEAYYDFREPLKSIAPGRLLAVRRGLKEGYLEFDIWLDENGAVALILSRVIRDPGSVFAAQLEASVRDAYQRLLFPMIQHELRQTIRERADDEAIRASQETVRSLLMTPPAGPLVVLGIETAHRTGCAAAVVDPASKHVATATVNLAEPKTNGEGPRAVLKELIVKHGVRAVSVASGPASREMDRFVRAVIRDEKLEDVFSVVVNEAGATAYSTSRLAREEFPDLEPPVRAAISIARRLQDPVAELVRIDPKAVAAGPYQHDLDQKSLGDKLHQTLESCVNQIGVDVNTASSALLRYVAGMNERLVKRTLEFRENNGSFRSREQLKEVPGFVPRIFQQAAGFLRVPGGENPLDRTRIHPEAYPIVEKMAGSLQVPVSGLMDRPEPLQDVKLDDLQSDSVGPAALRDILEELREPGRDPRGKFTIPQYKNDVLLISDLKEGMELEGVVTNVTSFGAFVDVGVQQDGLVHISELSGKFVKDPHAAVKVGDIVKVRVLAADVEARRISLSMKPSPPPKPERPPRPARPVRQDGRPQKELAVPAGAAPAQPRPQPVARAGEAGAPSKDRSSKARGPQGKPKELSLEEKLAILQSKFRTRV